MRKKQIAIFTIFVAVFVLLVLFGRQSEVELPSSEGSAERNAIEAVDQTTGKMVNMTTVELMIGGFVIIHSDQFDFPADILGSSDYIEPGIYHNFPVSLNEKSVTGDKMIAVLHEDNGDRLFSPADDFSIQDTDKKIIMSAFTVE